MKPLALLLLAAAVPAAAQTGPALRPFASDEELVAHLAAMRPPPPPPAVQPPPPAGPHAVVHGWVSNPGGAPEAAVLVRIEALNVGTVTAADGHYRLYVPAARFSPGQAFTVTASRAGLASGTAGVTLTAGGSAAADFTLAPQAILLEGVTISGKAAGATITNVQHAGVDEGGIVKRHGKHLVILRRGRLFTVEVGGRSLRPVDVVDASGPENDPRGTWYDELLVSDDRVVVIGFSYARGGTEIGLFRIDGAGRLHYRGTHHLRSRDYYSSRNYASRLVDGRLVLYAPVPVSLGRGALEGWMPAWREWRGDARDPFRRTLPATRVYASGQPLFPHDGPTLHTVTSCDLARARLECEASAVLGPAGRVFYVAPGAVYVWTTPRHRPGGDEAASTLFRLPLDGSAPRSLAVHGSPVDQFSFLESDDRHLNVLVRDAGSGDGMWDAERARGGVALLRVPLSRFGDAAAAAPASAYLDLPRPRGGAAFHNRFVGAHLLYGEGAGWGTPGDGGATLYAVHFRDGGVGAVALDHGVDRIEAMGADAVVVGARGADLHFTGVRLGASPRAVQRYVQRGASQGETRSHGFFYREDAQGSGVLGLPVRGPGRPGYEHRFDESASVLFLRNASGAFRPLGELEGRPLPVDDRCVASCVDWYGNTRPVFMDGRVFALLGYELVEGTISGDAIREVRRVTFSPDRFAVRR